MITAARVALALLFLLTALLWPTTYERNDVSLPFVDRHSAGFDIYARYGQYELITGDSDLIGVTTFPMWLAMLVSLAGWIGLGFVRRTSALQTGRCSLCGYDLRASPDRCPECGKPVAK